MRDENVELEYNTDRGGGVVRYFALPTDASPQVCRQECLKEDRCRAFVFRRAGEGLSAFCWLKELGPVSKASSQFVSGVVRP
jgi:hypothetical protein